MIHPSSPSAPLIALAAALAAPAAWAHAELQASTPAAHAALPASPEAIRLQFSEPLEAKFSTIRLVDAGGKDVATGPAAFDPGDPKVMRLALPRLAAGAYTVRWTTMARDGHRAKGAYDFSVR